jgi:hypothetical protein
MSDTPTFETLAEQLRAAEAALAESEKLARIAGDQLEAVNRGIAEDFELFKQSRNELMAPYHAQQTQAHADREAARAARTEAHRALMAFVVHGHLPDPPALQETTQAPGTAA